MQPLIISNSVELHGIRISVLTGFNVVAVLCHGQDSQKPYAH